MEYYASIKKCKIVFITQFYLYKRYEGLPLSVPFSHTTVGRSGFLLNEVSAAISAGGRKMGSMK
jgi:hypothetical protein